MAEYRLSLLGFGNVGQAFLRLLLAKKDQLVRQYGVSFIITGIATARHGIAVDPQGIDAGTALRAIASHASLTSLSASRPVNGSLEFIQACQADVLFETTPVNYTDGQPAVSYINTALQAGMHVVSANKGPVVHAYPELSELARQHKRKYFFESAVMDGAPIFSLFRQSLPAIYLHSFYGILNSTTNLILSRMEQGHGFENSVAYAQSIGLAETDPSGDIDGWDAAVKVCALVTVLMAIPLKPAEVDRTGIRHLSSRDIRQATQENKRWKLVCRARRTGDTVQASVRPELVSSDSPLYGVNGTSSMVTFETDVLPQLSIVEGNPGPETTAYGLLADLIHVTR